MCRWAKRYHKKVSADGHLPEAYEVAVREMDFQLEFLRF
jgi:hypothetical protein